MGFYCECELTEEKLPIGEEENFMTQRKNYNYTFPQRFEDRRECKKLVVDAEAYPGL